MDSHHCNGIPCLGHHRIPTARHARSGREPKVERGKGPERTKNAYKGEKESQRKSGKGERRERTQRGKGRKERRDTEEKERDK